MRPDAAQTRLAEFPSQQYASAGKRLGQRVRGIGESQLRIGLDGRESRHLVGTGGALDDNDGSSHTGLVPVRNVCETELSQLLRARWWRGRHCDKVFAGAILPPSHSSRVPIVFGLL